MCIRDRATIGATMHFAKASTTTLSLDTNNSDFNVSFFPNPTKDTLNINLGSITETNYTFSLIDINGKEILNIPVPVSYTHLDVYKRQI